MHSQNRLTHSTHSTSLADILERVLDKGIVIAGDIKVCLADVELLSIKIRLVICSVDKAMAIGINWWQNDPSLSTAQIDPAGAIAAKLERQVVLPAPELPPASPAPLGDF